MRVLQASARVIRSRHSAPFARASAPASTSPFQIVQGSLLWNNVHLHPVERTAYSTSATRDSDRFAFGSTFPTADESALLAHVDDEFDVNSSRLVCGSCNAPLSNTKDLAFFKWRNGIHLSSITDAPLHHLCAKDTWDEGMTWKKHKLHCLKCDHHVGTLARVFSSDKILFSATKVAIQMPENQSPLMSLSGYPSSLLGFSMWSELILMVESQPRLKEALQIRRVDHIRDFSQDRKNLNTELLMAKDLRSLLRVVDKSSSEFSYVNICTALDRAARLVSPREQQRDVVPFNHHSHTFSKSEAPEDLLLAVSSPLFLNPRTEKANAIEQNGFSKLIQATENLVHFGINVFQDGTALARTVTSLWRLGIGRQSILEPIAKQMSYMANLKESQIDAYVASIVSSGIVHLCSKEVRNMQWIKEMLHTAATVVIDESEKNGEAVSVDILIPLVRSFVMVDEFHDELFRLLFQEIVEKDQLEKIDIARYKVKILKSKMYQIHLDCVLNHRQEEFQLSPSQEQEYKQLFQDHQKQVKSKSFRLQHLVSTALDQMKMAHTASYAMEEGYAVDFVLPKHRIGIEINNVDCYQVPEDQRREEGIVNLDDDKPFAFVDLKTRHLEQLGWVVIQIHANRFQGLPTLEERVKYLSMLLEVATMRRRDAQREQPTH